MKMKKFINSQDNLTPELLEGFAAANKDLVTLGDERMIINNQLKDADRVTIVTQGGSGHEPAISGFVGEGMVDISVVGDVFAAPGPQACFDAIKMADKGKGVLYIVLNHAGDMLTGNLTMKMCKKEKLNVMKVVTQEDIANAPRENSDDRRGLVGLSRLIRLQAQPQRKERAWKRWRESPRNLPTTWRRLPLPSAAQPIRPPAACWLTLAKTRWKSAWDSTARAAADASR